MRTALCTALLALTPALGSAQQRIEITRAPRVMVSFGDDSRAAIGISTGGNASARDTLGLLVTAITPNGPAEKAGIEEGDRLISANGENLRLAAADVGDMEMSGVMQRRLIRVLSKAKAGTPVALTVWSGGQVRSVTVTPVASDSLYPERRRLTAARWVEERNDKPVIGVNLGANGSKRDTLGVFISSVVDSGPAALAGIVEGSRIASIGGVDLRVSRADAGDAEVAAARARRLERAVGELKPGTETELRVWQDGQYRTFRVKVGRAGDLPHDNRFYFFGDGTAPTPPMPPMAPAMPMPMPTPAPEAFMSMPMQLRMQDIGAEVQRELDRARQRERAAGARAARVTMSD